MKMPPAGSTLRGAAAMLPAMPRRFAFLDHPLPLAFAHRGGALEAEENTLEAFAHAAALGFTHVETDVQATRDGAAVLFHDDTLDRMTGAAGRLEALSAAEVEEILQAWLGAAFEGGRHRKRLDKIERIERDRCKGS